MENDLGAKVKKLRIQHGLTQEDVAKALDVTPGYISNVENGRNLMTLRMLSYYADLTHVSLDYLAGSVDKSYQNTALDNEIMQLVQKLDADTKEKLIQTLRIWSKEIIGTNKSERFICPFFILELCFSPFVNRSRNSAIFA